MLSDNNFLLMFYNLGHHVHLIHQPVIVFVDPKCYRNFRLCYRPCYFHHLCFHNFQHILVVVVMQHLYDSQWLKMVISNSHLPTKCRPVLHISNPNQWASCSQFFTHWIYEKQKKEKIHCQIIMRHFVRTNRPIQST